MTTQGSKQGSKSGLDRRQVVSTLLADRNELLVITGLGSPSYDAMAAGDHDQNYYLWCATRAQGNGDNRRRRDADGNRVSGHHRGKKTR